jgi:hypothetical protein
MARHFGIITFLTNSPKDSAIIDVSVDLPTGSRVPIKFTVFDPATGIPAAVSDFTQGSQTATDPGFLVSSGTSTIPNLYTPVNNQAAVVLAETCDATTGGTISAPSNAVLRQISSQTKNLVLLPSADVSLGTLFSFPLGALAQGAYAFVTAIGIDASPMLQFGTAAPTALPPIKAYTPTAIKLQTGSSRVNLWTTDPAQQLLVIFGVDTGKVDETILLPGG